MLAAAATLTLTACSDSSDDAPEPSPSSASSPSATTSATTAAPTTEPPAALPSIEELVVAPGRIGAVRTGMTREEAVDTGLFDEDVSIGGEECGRSAPLGWKPDYASSLDVLTTDDGAVV